jgi:hypothetical protein
MIHTVSIEEIAMVDLFLLSERQMSRIPPFFPLAQPHRLLREAAVGGLRSDLVQSCRHRPITARASVMVVNTSLFSHSSRNLPLKNGRIATRQQCPLSGNGKRDLHDRLRAEAV